MPNASQHLARPLAIAILVTGSFLFAANHVAARVAFDDGTGVLLAILTRGSIAFLMMLTLVLAQKHRLSIPSGKRRWQCLLGIMIAGQSLCLYSAVARIPVAVALLLVNTWPILYTLLTWLLGGRRPTLRLTLIMTIILIGLVMVLDLGTWLADPAAMGPDWLPGVILAESAALFFAVAIWVTENRLSQLPGAIRSVFTMMTVLVLMALGGVLGIVPGGLNLPQSQAGWVGLASLAALYGTASTILFVLVPRLNMARNAPVMNLEPVASLLLGFLILGQTLAPVQLLGGAVVLSGIVWLSLMRQG
ncbi:MAG: EamA family transporter [Porticoccus sp.]|jgi:drug/metabolite transporter (DMT)-like permease|nr:EamA family transporter [Porticoccus sp.]|tara:strand:- start:81776 stop:82690 length:915 start_codon:yes stop_codon:yes gene_type:complete